MRLIISTIIFMSVLLNTGQVRGEAAPAIEILKKAESASAKLTSISYEASGYGEGELSKILPKVVGKVVAQRGAGVDDHKFAIHGEITPGGIPSARFSFISDGKNAHRVDHRQKACLNGTLQEARVDEGILIPPHYLHPNPYWQELNAASATLEPSQKVGEVDCDVVKVQYDRNGDRGGRFYFGKQDHLLRRLDRIFAARNNGTVTDQVVVYSCNLLKPGGNIDPMTFVPECPSGFTKKTFVEARQPVQQQAVAPPAAGSNEAPDWTLKNSEGKDISLKSLRGRVVLMDFWATWCGPCKMAMPSMQKIHDHFKGKPVDVFGVNCWPRGDPKMETQMALKYVKDRGFTYPQLLEASDVARQYGVSGIPTFFVIGPDGRIVHRASGFHQGGEAQIIAIIEQALQKK